MLLNVLLTLERHLNCYEQFYVFLILFLIVCNFFVIFHSKEPELPLPLEKAELPKLVIVGIALAGLGLLVVNAVLVAWFIIRRRNKGIYFYLFVFVFGSSTTHPEGE